MTFPPEEGAGFGVGPSVPQPPQVPRLHYLEPPWQPPQPPPPPRRSLGWLWGLLAAAAAVIVVASVLVATRPFTEEIAGHASLKESATATPEPSPSGVSLERYDSPAGGFSVMLPCKPIEKTIPIKVATITETVTVATCAAPLTQVSSEVISEALPRSQFRTTLRVALNGFASAADFTLEDEHETTFRGNTARAATTTAPDGTAMSVEAFFVSPTRLVLVDAPTDVFDEVLHSLVLN